MQSNLTYGILPILAHLVGGVVHDRVAVVGMPVGVTCHMFWVTLFKLTFLFPPHVLHIYGDKVISVGAHVGVVHADAMEDLEWISSYDPAC